MLKKDAATSWTEDYQKAFDKIKEYLSTPLVLVPPEPGRPLLLYLSVLDGAFGCVLGHHDETGRKEQAIYYLSKKFTPYEARHYFYAYTTYLLSRMDPLKYIFQKPMSNGKLAKWQILLSESDIIYVTQKAVKGQALTDYLAKNPIGGEYEQLKMYFPDEEVSFIGEDIAKAYDGWRMFFDGATNFKGVGIGAVLVSKTGQHYSVSAKLRFPCTNNIAEYEACILGLNLAVYINVQELLVIGDSDLLIHADMIRVPPNELNATSAPWPFAAWGMNVIGPIEPTALNGHNLILVAINYFTKWVEVASYKAVTKKVIVDFVRDYIICRFGVPESIITDNAANLNSDLMKAMCETFKIKHKNSTAYKPQMNGAVEATNKNIKKILRKMVENQKQWHEKLTFALLGYRNIVRTSTGVTPYLLVYGTEAVILAEVEIPSLRIIQEAELSDAEWIRSRYEQLALIDGKMMNVVCHGQLYQNRMSRAFNKRIVELSSSSSANLIFSGEVPLRSPASRSYTLLVLTSKSLKSLSCKIFYDPHSFENLKSIVTNRHWKYCIIEWN
ncbi:uncharacterized protein [Nicotiana sylvestris]|uniref:uncharacterized protein n=1 Tax=Nicotiana sylvestris TaxID=4096 RepID=UPI00388C79EE